MKIYTCKKCSRVAALLLIFMVFGCKERTEKSAETGVVGTRDYDITVVDEEVEVEARGVNKGEGSEQITVLVEKVNSSKARLLSLCKSGNYTVTNEVKHAYLEYAKAKARADMAAMNRAVPDEFLAWIDSDPEVQASVYGSRDTSANIIMMLYSLRLDLGKEDFEKYRQIALAHAIVHENQGAKADLAPRDPLKLVIPKCPLKRVNTKDASRQLDQNDHIINFLDDHFVEEKTKEKIVKRSLFASDVLASQDLQIQFNDYMKQNGYDLTIDCGNMVIHPNSKKSIKGPKRKEITKAYHLFRRAYIAKGLLPAKRDPAPSPGQACVFLVRNDKEMAVLGRKSKKRPLFALTSPWPLMTLLASDRTPLREREDIWRAYKERGQMTTYGEYVGGIAQQPELLAARRLRPFPFAYGSFPMMRKDGGVCGTMANLCTTTYNALGIPASMVRQPGHAALVYFLKHKDKGFECKGSQFGKSGPEHTQVMYRWHFGNSEKQRKDKAMVYHMSIAWAINHGFGAYLDSMIAYQIFRMLPASEREVGIRLLESGLTMNPYNALLVEDVLSNGSALKLVRFWPKFTSVIRVAGEKPGCPPGGLYLQTMKKRLFAEIGRRPIPKEQESVKEILVFLEKEKCDRPPVILSYRKPLEKVQDREDTVSSE